MDDSREQTIPAPARDAGLPTTRAQSIVDGLVKTGRAAKPRLTKDFILLDRDGERGFYWVSIDGERVLKGDTPSTAEELQPGFLQAMERVGQRRQNRRPD